MSESVVPWAVAWGALSRAGRRRPTRLVDVFFRDQETPVAADAPAATRRQSR